MSWNASPVVEPVAVASLPVPSWPSVVAASGLYSRAASATETTLAQRWS
ncbi:MAG: hypothetical protein LBB58_04185 [Cellulomonadaceae bacterium]|nr:hypothetical protein [Cellulomonadaceae bacterium]